MQNELKHGRGAQPLLVAAVSFEQQVQNYACELLN